MTNMPTDQKAALLVVSLSSFIMPLMLSSVNVALPTIAASLHAEALLLSWISTAYLLSSAIFLLPFGKLADNVGRKKIYLSGMIIVTLASLFAATSQTIYQLIGWRVLQGFGAAMLFATGVAILTSIFPPEKRGGAIGVTVSAVYFGLACGPLFGGWMTQHFSWRSVFVVHLPVALFCIFVAWSKLEGDSRGRGDEKFDFIGTLLYAVTICSLMIGLSLLPSLLSLIVLSLCAISLYAFIQIERKIDHPIFAIGMFQNNRVLTFSCLSSLILYSSTFALTFLMSLYLQNIRGISPQSAGLILILQPLVMALFSPYMGKLSDRYEPRYLASMGMCLISLGFGLLTALQQSTSLTYILCSLFLIGLGFALFSSPNVNAIMGSVDKKYLGVASGTLGTTRVLGQMFSMAIVTLAFALLMGNSPLIPENYPALLQSIRASLFTACALTAFGVYLSMARGNVR
ncbi:MAG: EmrB/QacA subfamily drug resistance transporter [Planctomycetota bacterium]|jgi:EmrB/QacA subfamily drug resistance transporter